MGLQKIGNKFYTVCNGQRCDEWTSRDVIVRAIFGAVSLALNGKAADASLVDALKDEWAHIELSGEQIQALAKDYKKELVEVIEGLQAHVDGVNRIPACRQMDG